MLNPDTHIVLFALDDSLMPDERNLPARASVRRLGTAPSQSRLGMKFRAIDTRESRTRRVIARKLYWNFPLL
jgi:hypothetical protein